MANIMFLLITAVIIIFLITAILKFAKKLIHMIISFAVVAFLIIIFLYVYSDISDVNKKFDSSKKLFLLELDGLVVAGFSAEGSKPVEPLSTVSGMNDFFLAKELDKLLGDNYRLFIFDWNVFEDLSEVEFQGNVMQKSEIVNSLRSGEVPAEIKGFMFAVAFQQGMTNEKFIRGLKEGTIIVHKETATFKLLKLLPAPLAEKLVQIKG